MKRLILALCILSVLAVPILGQGTINKKGEFVPGQLIAVQDGQPTKPVEVEKSKLGLTNPVIVMCPHCGQKIEIRAFREAHIQSWSKKTDGTVDKIWVAVDGEHLPVKSTDLRLIWMKIGTKVVLPKWFTVGKEAQKIPGNKLAESWKGGMPGVFKMNYDSLFVREEVFKGLTVEVSKN